MHAMCVEMGKCIVCFKEEKIMLLIPHTIMLPIPPESISSSTDHISYGSVVINQNSISYLFSVLWLELYIVRYHEIQLKLYVILSCFNTIHHSISVPYLMQWNIHATKPYLVRSRNTIKEPLSIRSSNVFAMPYWKHGLRH